MKQLSVMERHNKILEMLDENGRVSVNELSELFGVSSVIIRNDLTELEKKDLLTRVHGGAITSYKSYHDMSLVQRSNAHSVEKQKIAEKIAEYISDNDTVMLNAGTTPLFVMRAIKEKRVTILTNSIVLALEAASNPNFKIILLGGEVDENYQFTYGTQVLRELENYHPSVLILSVDGIDAKGVMSTYYHHEVEISKKMMAQSSKTIIAADYSKISRTAFSNIGKIEKGNLLVTNHKAVEKELHNIIKCGVKVITV